MLKLAKKLTLLISCWAAFSAFLAGTALGQEVTKENEIVPLRIGDTIPDSLWYYKMPLYEGLTLTDSLSLADFGAEDRTLIIDFWPFWCSPCIKSVLRLDSIVQDRQYENVKFLSVNVIDTEKRLLDFTKQSGFQVPTLYDFSYLVNRLLTRYSGYYGVLMIKGRTLLGSPDIETLSVSNLDKIEQGKWEEQSITFRPEILRLQFAKDLGRGGKL